MADSATSSRLKRFYREHLLTGEGQVRMPGSVLLLGGLLLAIFILELADSAPLVLYLAFVGVLGYAAGERRGHAQASEVEPVAPPYIPSEGE